MWPKKAAVKKKTPKRTAAEEKPSVQFEPASQMLLVDDFNAGETSGLYYRRLNSLGGYQGTWAKRPSYALITKSEVQRRGDEGFFVSPA